MQRREFDSVGGLYRHLIGLIDYASMVDADYSTLHGPALKRSYFSLCKLREVFLFALHDIHSCIFSCRIYHFPNFSRAPVCTRPGGQE